MANRETQVSIEVGRVGASNALATQIALEVALTVASNVRVTQLDLEIAMPRPPGPTQQEILIFAMP